MSSASTKALTLPLGVGTGLGQGICSSSSAIDFISKPATFGYGKITRDEYNDVTMLVFIIHF